MVDAAAMVAAVHAYVASFETGDAERAAALFADDASVEDPVGTPPHVGRDAIRAFYTASMATGAKLVLDGPIRVAAADVAFAMQVHLTWAGQPTRIDVIDHFAFDEDGKIQRMKAFFGPSNIHTQTTGEDNA